MKTTLAWVSILSVFLFACSDSQDAISTAVQQTVDTQDAIGTAVQQTVDAHTPVVQTVERTVVETAPVTVEVVTEVEITREVEVTREIRVTRQVKITQIIERVITATPMPMPEVTDTPVPADTPEPTPTSTLEPTNTPRPWTAPPTAPPPDITATLLQTLRDTRDKLQRFGGLIDSALRSGSISCQDVVDLYDGIAGAPTYDVRESGAIVQNAYNNYRSSVQIFTTGARDMTQNCRDFLADPSGGSIPFQQWGLARQEVNKALDVLHPAIQSLE